MPALTPTQLAQYNEDGFIILEDLVPRDLVAQILDIAHADPQLEKEAKFNKNYDEGTEGTDTRLLVRSGLGDDAFSALGRSPWIVEPIQSIWNDRIRHFYHLNTRKDPGTGGWQWHQDYGYHYREFLWPKFLSVMVALDPATRENGCLQVVRGSNRLGRLDHRKSGSQLIADPERVAFALEELDVVHAEIEPGSALVFDGNVLHASDVNKSDYGRWALIYAYAAAGNRYVLPDIPEPLRDPVDMLSTDEVVESVARHRELIPVV